MGWKNVKTHYGIKHIVQVDKGEIRIGSGYAQALIVVTLDGVLKETGLSMDGYLSNTLEQMRADPEKLKELVLTPDTFEKSIPVFTYTETEVVEKVCEELGWPRTTHCGELMYENQFFAGREHAVARLLEEAQFAVTYETRNLLRAQEAVRDREKALAEASTRLATVKANYLPVPSPVVESTDAGERSFFARHDFTRDEIQTQLNQSLENIAQAQSIATLRATKSTREYQEDQEAVASGKRAKSVWITPPLTVKQTVALSAKSVLLEMERAENVRVLELTEEGKSQHSYILTYSKDPDEDITEGTGPFNTLKEAKDWYLNGGR